MTASASTTAAAAAAAATTTGTVRVSVLVHDALLGRSLAAALRDDGFDVETPPPPADTARLASLVAESQPDLVVVELGAPSPCSVEATLEAIGCCGRAADQQTTVPRVIGLAPPAAEDVRITALLAGADDAVSTPIAPGELTARCRAVLRRPGTGHPTTARRSPSLLAFGPLTVDVGRREIRVLGHDVPVTRIEYALFEQLFRHPDEVRPRTTLVRDVWGPHWVGDTHIVDVHLSNLRRKIHHVAPDVHAIHTVRGIGFRLGDDLVTAATYADHRLSA